MPNVVSDIITGPVKVLYAPYATQYPADNLAADAAWPSGWVEVGMTKAPVTMAYEYEVEDITVEQSLAPVRRRKTSHVVRFETVLAEFTSDLLAQAFNGTSTVTAPGVSQVGKDELDLGDVVALPEQIWAFEGKYVDEDAAVFPIRVIIHKGTAAAGGELEFSKTEYTGIPLRVDGLSDMSRAEGERLFYIIKVTEPET